MKPLLAEDQTHHLGLRPGAPLWTGTCSSSSGSSCGIWQAGSSTRGILAAAQRGEEYVFIPLSLPK
jgi:hypothetical protein